MFCSLTWLVPFFPTLKLIPSEMWVSNCSMEVPSGTTTGKGSWMWSKEKRSARAYLMYPFQIRIYWKTKFKSYSSRKCKSVLTHCPHELNWNLCLTFFSWDYIAVFIYQCHRGSRLYFGIKLTLLEGVIVVYNSILCC